MTRTLIDADASRARRAELVDKMAAAYILQGAIDALDDGLSRTLRRPASMPALSRIATCSGSRGFRAADILAILDEAEQWIAFNRGARKADDRLAGLTQINAFFENSTRTLFSFEIAGKRLGAQVVELPSRRVERAQGREPDRHRADPQRDAARHARHPPRGERRARPTSPR